MRDSIWSKRFPTLLGVIMIVFGIVATSYLNRNGLIFGGNASPSNIPHDVRITNISDTSFTVSYFTDTPVSGSLVYGKDEKLGNLANDLRDGSGQQGSYTTHYIVVTNLSPNTKYFFTISSGDESFNQADTNAPFTVTTGQTLQANAQPPPTLRGKIILSDGSPAVATLVYVSAPPHQMLSALTQNDGGYIIPLATMRTQDGSGYAPLLPTTPLNMFLSTETLASQVTLLVNQASAVPTITLSNSYDFSVQTTPLTTNAPTASSGASLGFPAFTSRENPNAKAPGITSPKINEGIKDQQPMFRGTAPPGQSVTISIHSTEITATVTADQTGTWSFRPTQPLNPGAHTITITTKDAFGILKTITQSFTVYAAGTQVSQSATPSATLAITPTTRPSATPIPPTATPKLTASPTTGLSPTSSPTITIAPTPTLTSGPTFVIPTATPFLTPQPTLIPGSQSVAWMGLGAFVIALIGAGIFIVTKIPL